MMIREHSEICGVPDLNPFLGDSPSWQSYMKGTLPPSDFVREIEREAAVEGSRYYNPNGIGAQSLVDKLMGKEPGSGTPNRRRLPHEHVCIQSQLPELTPPLAPLHSRDGESHQAIEK